MSLKTARRQKLSTSERGRKIEHDAVLSSAAENPVVWASTPLVSRVAFRSESKVQAPFASYRRDQMRADFRHIHLRCNAVIEHLWQGEPLTSKQLQTFAHKSSFCLLFRVTRARL